MVSENAVAGRAGNFSLSISELELPSGQRISLPSPGVTAFVGPNNAGKSTILRQMNAHSVQGYSGGAYPSEPVLVRGMDISVSGDYRDAVAWIELHATTTLAGNGGRIFQRPQAGAVEERQVAHHLNTINSLGLQGIHGHVIFYGDAWNRIHAAQPTEMRDQFDMPPNHPIHVLQDRGDLFDELSELCEKVFRRPLTLDTLSKSMNIRVGSSAVEAPPVNRVSLEFRDALASLPMLDHQGDGMRSFIGLLLPILTSTYQVVIIDEPEAFLHPPQAVQLGRILGEQAISKGMQVILATHDKNILAGLIQSDVDVSIVRLDRPDEGHSTAHQLSVANLKRIWTDPVLKHSNALDGLFHKLVVLAEGDRDCTYYSAALEHLDAQSATPVAPSDVLFVPTGGKGGLPLLIEVLTSAKVPIVASPDLDVLDDRVFLRRLVDSFGGVWGEFERDYEIATVNFRRPREKARVSHVLNSLNEVFRARMNDDFDAEISAEFRALARSSESPWKALKLHGIGAWNGDPQAAIAAQRLLDGLDSLGIVAVRVGELEGFARTLTVRKGPEWVPAAIAGGFHTQAPTQEHVARIVTGRFAPLSPKDHSGA